MLTTQQKQLTVITDKLEVTFDVCEEFRTEFFTCDYSVYHELVSVQQLPAE